MSDAFFDTNLLIRYVTGDDPGKRAAVRNLLRQAAQVPFACMHPTP